jgi:diacylglycerol kinase (ATP)
MPSNIFFIVNPNSKSGKTKKMWESFILPEVLSLFPNANWSFTYNLFEASLLAFHAKKCGYDIVVAVGGDGTINEVVNGLMGNNLSRLQHNLPQIFGASLNLSIHECPLLFKPALACIPVGTGCDFVKSLHIPNNIKSALKIIQTGNAIDCDVGLIEFPKKHSVQSYSDLRYFINIAGCGANGETVKRINESKRFFGRRGSFLVAAIQTVLKNRNFPVQISYDGEESIPIDLRVLFVCNGQFCGGGMQISRTASLSSGKFRVIQIKKMNKLKSILLLNRLYSGDYSGLEGDIIEREVHSIKITTQDKFIIPAESDGEQPGFLPASFSILPSALSVYSSIS